MKRLILPVVAGILLALATLPPATAQAGPVVLFDQGHDQRFLIEKDEPLHLSGLAGIFRGEGLEVRSTVEPLTDESLRQIDALVISGPFKELTAPEVEAIVNFVARGGRLAAMIHIGAPFAPLTPRLEVDFTNYVLSEQEEIIDNDPRNFRVRTLAVDPLFSGIDHFSLYGSWALINSAPTARIIASTSQRAWLDLNGDRQLSRGDAVGSFGVVVTGEIGAGRFLLFGDDAVFQNRFLDDSNRLLARNLARWLK